MRTNAAFDEAWARSPIALKRLELLRLGTAAPRLSRSFVERVGRKAQSLLIDERIMERQTVGMVHCLRDGPDGWRASTSAHSGAHR